MRIAIMQGRLSPPQEERAQFFPHDWQAEFPVAKRIGFDGVTWFLDRTHGDPVRNIWGDPEALSRIDRAGQVLPIHSIDCDRTPLFGSNSQRTKKEFSILLPALASRLSSRTVVFALLLEAAPKSGKEKVEALRTLSHLLSLAQPLDLKLALETEMPASELAAFIKEAASPNVGVCYDLGSAAAFGFDGPAELRALGNRIFEVHVKDHKRGHVLGVDRSVYLGEGDVDFRGCAEALRDIGYEGGMTLQARRGEEYLADAERQLSFIRTALTKYGA